jgi:hypothetical protein
MPRVSTMSFRMLLDQGVVERIVIRRKQHHVVRRDRIPGQRDAFSDRTGTRAFAGTPDVRGSEYSTRAPRWTSSSINSTAGLSRMSSTFFLYAIPRTMAAASLEGPTRAHSTLP